MDCLACTKEIRLRRRRPIPKSRQCQKRSTMDKLIVVGLLGAVQCQRPLSGHHLKIVLWQTTFSVDRNVNGHVEKTTSFWEVFKWLSAKLGFSYSVVYSNPLFVNSTDVIGTSTYLLNRQADLYVGTLTMTESRNRDFDLPFPYVSGDIKVMMPVLKDIDFGSPWEPFQVEVWICILAVFVAAIGSLYLINRSTNRLMQAVQYFDLSRSLGYVVLVLMTQGSYCFPRNFSIRLVAASWCIGAFFLVNFYNSVLISSITTPTRAPLLNSIYDLPKKPNVYVAVEKDGGMDRVISEAKSGILKYINDTLSHPPSFRCATAIQCLQKVIEGTHVIIQSGVLSTAYINSVVIPRYGKCRVMLAKEGFMTSFGSFALPKHSPYTHYFNKETINLWQTGLINKWLDDFYPPVDQCTVKRSKLTRIGLKNLDSTFGLFASGVAISLGAFVMQVTRHFCKKLLSFVNVTPWSINVEKLIGAN